MSDTSKSVTFTALDTDHGRRLDQVLAARVPDLSRRLARVLVDLGGVFVDAQRTKVAGRPIRRGQTIVAHLGHALARATKETGQGARARDEERLPPYAILFEDEDIVVVHKPAGLLTAPTPESDRNNLQSLLSRRPEGNGQRLFVVHRLDLLTSGVLVVAKSVDANIVLSERFRTHDLTRAYLAVVSGAFPDACRRHDSPVGGKHAVSHFVVEERFGTRATLIRCTLETGRTHQIRIHCGGLGHPVLGDRQYGQRSDFDPPRMALHATLLAFAHPRTGIPLTFTAPLPEDLATWLIGSLRNPLTAEGTTIGDGFPQRGTKTTSRK